MTMQRVLSKIFYTSGTGNQQYSFAVSVNSAGICQITDIRSPLGSFCQMTEGLPSSVLTDMLIAKQQTEDIVASTSAVSGLVTFSNQISQTITFVNPLSSDTYGISITLPDFISWRIENPTQVGFTIALSTAYTGILRYDVFL